MGLSFLRGLVAAVNPCGFILLPTYLMYFLGLQGQHPGSQRASIRRALVVSAAVSAGFLTVFVAAGLISVHFTQWINRNARYATVVIGVALVVLGVAMLFGYKLPISTPQLDAGGRRRTIGSMFVYGIAYAVASIGCTIGLFLATLLGSTRSDGVLSGVANVVAYGAGWRWSSPPSRSRSPSPTPVCCACSAPACVTSRRSPPCSSSCPVCTSCTTSGSST